MDTRYSQAKARSKANCYVLWIKIRVLFVKKYDCYSAVIHQGFTLYDTEMRMLDAQLMK